MVRGPVVADEAREWSSGRLRSSDYFAKARQRALERATDSILGRLRRLGAAPPADERPAG